MSVEKKLAELKLTLPQSAPSKGIYRKCLAVGGLLYVSGHISVKNDGSYLTGKLGKDISEDDAKIAARQSASAKREPVSPLSPATP